MTHMPLGPIIVGPSPEERLADAIERLTNALLGWRTTTIGEMTVTEPIEKRWQPKPCLKCTSEAGRVRWHVGAADSTDFAADHESRRCSTRDQGNSGHNREHLHVYCEVCHFDWIELLPRP